MREKLPQFIFELRLKFVFSPNYSPKLCFVLFLNSFELLYLCSVICSQSICRCSNVSKNKRDNGCQYVMEKIVEVVYILAGSFATVYGTEERKSVRYTLGANILLSCYFFGNWVFPTLSHTMYVQRVSKENTFCFLYIILGSCFPSLLLLKLNFLCT